MKHQRFNNADDTGDIGEFINSDTLTIPCGVYKIGYQVQNYKDYKNITTINVPDTVTTIGNGAFYYCQNLKYIEIPQSVTRIESSSFSECTSLQSITLPNSLTFIGQYAFRDCLSLVDLVIPNSVTVIGYDAFSGCLNLVTVNIPTGISILNVGVFQYCKSLTSINVPYNVQELYAYAFAYCQNLACIHFSRSSISISDSAFYGTQFESRSNFNSSTCPSTIFVECQNNSEDYIKYANGNKHCVDPSFVNYYHKDENNEKQFDQQCPSNMSYYIGDEKPYQCVQACNKDYAKPSSSSKHCTNTCSFRVDQIIEDTEELDNLCIQSDSCNYDEYQYNYSQDRIQCMSKCSEAVSDQDVYTIEEQQLCVLSCGQINGEYIVWSRSEDGKERLCSNKTECDSLGELSQIQFIVQDTHECILAEKGCPETHKYAVNKVCLSSCYSLEPHQYVNYEENTCISSCGSTNDQKNSWYQQDNEQICNILNTCPPQKQLTYNKITPQNQCVQNCSQTDIYQFLEDFNNQIAQCVSNCNQNVWVIEDNEYYCRNSKTCNQNETIITKTKQCIVCDEENKLQYTECQVKQASDTNDQNQNQQNNKLSDGAIAGIVIGVAAVVGIIIGSVFYIRKKKSSKKNTDNKQQNNMQQQKPLPYQQPSNPQQFQVLTQIVQKPQPTQFIQPQQQVMQQPPTQQQILQQQPIQQQQIVQQSMQQQVQQPVQQMQQESQQQPQQQHKKKVVKIVKKKKSQALTPLTIGQQQ